MAAAPRHGLWQRLAFWLAGHLGAMVCRAWFATCRVVMLSPEEEKRMLREGNPGVGVTWHRGAIYFLSFFGKYKPAIMVSRSKDGEYLARYIQAMGGLPVRGSSQHGGLAALNEMAEFLNSGQTLYGATVADGPRGPRYRAKKGMIVLAQRAGLPLYPIMWSADRVWVLGKTWDRTMLPKPFSRIYVKAGRIFTYPKRMTPQELEAARVELEDELNRLRDELDQIAGFQDPD